MKSQIALAGLALALLPMTALAAPANIKPAKMKPAPRTVKAAAMYECAKCHMKVTAAVAKKDNYKDPMDGGTLVPVKTAKH